jgi:uncharacterized membrane protein
MSRILVSVLLIVPLLIGAIAPSVALAQAPQEPSVPSPVLTVFTGYPAQETEIGEIVTFPLTLRIAGPAAQVVRLGMGEVPEGWTATFRGGGRVIEAVYVEAEEDATADLRLEPPKDISPGTYRFVVLARGEGVEAELPIELTVAEKLPPSLELSVELPTLKGTPTTTFRYQATLKNSGDEDLTVNFAADVPAGFQATITSSGQEVADLPLKANESKRLDIEVKPYGDVPAGQYLITVQALGGEAQATIGLTAEVTGQPNLSITSPDGRLSGQAYAGDETPLKILVQNTGSAPARDIQLSASAPSGWSVEFEPKQIPEIAASTQVEVTAKLRPAGKAIAGDYMVTINTRSEGSPAESAEFRITVLTSTLWGMVGIGLIAVAVVVVGLAVLRFGRR